MVSISMASKIPIFLGSLESSWSITFLRIYSKSISIKNAVNKQK